MRDHLRLIVNTHTRPKPTWLPLIIVGGLLLHFRCLHLSDQGSLVWCMMLCAASSDGISRLHNWYFVLSMITYCPQNLLARRACTLVISTRPTINLHATGERASVNFGHCSWGSVSWFSYHYTCLSPIQLPVTICELGLLLSYPTLIGFLWALWLNPTPEVSRNIVQIRAMLKSKRMSKTTKQQTIKRGALC